MIKTTNLKKIIKSLNKSAEEYLTASQVDYIVQVTLMTNDFFKNRKKVVAWLTTPNPNFGGSSPLSLILLNRGKKVISFIKEARGGY